MFEISKGLEINKLGKKYYFKGQCEWSKNETLTNVGAMCSHDDCKKSFYINLGIEECRQALRNLMLK